jgi:hypothetical protein
MPRLDRSTFLPKLLMPALIALGGVTLGALPASATVVVLHSIEKMTQNADVIVHARVGDSRVTREQGRTVTLTEIEVLDGYKGAKPGDVLTIYQVGGVWEGQRTEVIGAYAWTAGEEIVLFAVNHTGGRIVTYGVGVGRYHVERDGVGVEVVPSYGDVAVMRQAQGGANSMGPPPTPVARPLSALKADVMTAMQHTVQLPAKTKVGPTADQLRRTKLRAVRKPTTTNNAGR